ncbi:MAG: hypothetical protein QXR45_09430 [Candidatus Bathyarchaeia archaeon]
MKVKGLLLIAALLTSSLMLISPVAAPTNKFYLSPAEQSGHVGGTVSFNVMIDSFSNLNAYQFALRWDQSVLKFKNITFVWLITQGPTDNAYTVSIVGNELTASEWLMDPDLGVSGTDKVFATIEWDIVAGGETKIEFIETRYWKPGADEVECTAVNGFFYTEEPFVDFVWTPTGPRANEIVTYDGRLSKPTEAAVGDFPPMDGVVDSYDLGVMGGAWGAFPEDPNWNPYCDLAPDGVIDSSDLGVLGAHWGEFGNYIAEYYWYIDNELVSTEPTATYVFNSYSKTAHNITLVCVDSEGDSFAKTKMQVIDRDLAIFSIWPSPEDYMGSIVWNIPSGKYVIVMVRIANVGTITEYTDNSQGDFPSTTALKLYLVHSDGTEEVIKPPIPGVDGYYGRRLRRYRYALDAQTWIWKYDWDPLVGVYQWFFWDTWGLEPETGVYLKANLTAVPGETDLSNNELWFGPFNITEGFEHDIRIEGIFTYDEVDYIHPYPPFPGTTFKLFYGPYTPGSIANITVAFSNIGSHDETFTYHVYAGSWENEIWSETVTITVEEGYAEFTFPWNTTGYYGTYTLWVTVDPVEGETGRWAVWDNNIKEMYDTYGIMFPFAYDDWGIYETFP